MTHRQKWLEVAEAFGTPYEKRPLRQWKMALHGLCDSFIKFSGGDQTIMTIMPKLKNFAGFQGYWFPIRMGPYISRTKINHPNMSQDEADNLRCLYACLFAAMTEKEFEEITSYE